MPEPPGWIPGAESLPAFFAARPQNIFFFSFFKSENGRRGEDSKNGKKETKCRIILDTG